MVIDEGTRHAMHSRLQEVLGKGHAAVLMEHLPPVGWADVATKRDLEQLRLWMEARLEAVGIRFDALEHRLVGLEARLDGIDGRLDRMDARFDRMDGRLDHLDDRIDALTRTMIYTVLSAVATVGGLAFAAARLV